MNLKNKKVVVTGGSGVIGKELIAMLEKEGANIRCFDIEPRPNIFSDKIEYCQRDLSMLNPIEFINFDPEVIFHLAAVFERTIEESGFWNLSFQNELLLNHYVFDAAKECKNLKKFIFASSYLIYDPTLYLFKNPVRQAVKLKEEDRIDPRNLCGAAKLYGEKELNYLAGFEDEYPFVSAHARIFRVYGRGSKDIISRWIRAALRGQPAEVFMEGNFFDYIFSEDVAGALLKIAEKDRAVGVINVGSGKSESIESVVGFIKREIPSFKIKKIAKKDFFEASCGDISKLYRLTKWKPSITLKRGIKKVIDYERETFQK